MPAAIIECSCRSGWRRKEIASKPGIGRPRTASLPGSQPGSRRSQPDARQPQRPHRRSRCRGPRGAHHGFQSVHLCARHWVRDTGLLDVGRAVHQLSRRRGVVRLADRGVVAPGYFADVNVVHRQGLELQAPDMLSDLPLGRTLPATSPRLRLHPRQGQVLIDHDKLTEVRSGQLVLPPEITCSPRCTSHAARALRALSLAAGG